MTRQPSNAARIMLVAIGPLAELAINRVMVRALREQVADAVAIADRRADEAFEAGIKRGRGAWPIALLFGFMVGVAMTGLYFVIVQ